MKDNNYDFLFQLSREEKWYFMWNLSLILAMHEKGIKYNILFNFGLFINNYIL